MHLARVLYNDPMPTLAALEGYVQETSSALFALAARILAPPSAEIEHLARHAGFAQGAKSQGGNEMAFEIGHVHLKCADPKQTAAPLWTSDAHSMMVFADFTSIVNGGLVVIV